MVTPGTVATSAIGRFASRLRFPRLFLLTAAIFLLDLAVPDLIPAVDEILLALGTILFGMWKNRRAPAPERGESDSP